MKRRLLLLGFLITSILSFGQCPNSTITLSTQAEVDDFVLTYPNCSELLDNLFIDGSNITNLKGLSGIASIEGRFEVRNTQILDFKGLEFLEMVGGTFDIFNNNVLIDLSGLDMLESVRRLFIRENTNLKSLDGLDSLTTIEEQESIFIVENDSLISINGLSTVVNCPDCSIDLDTNPNLTNLEGLENISSTEMFYLRLVDNSNLVVCNLENICTYLSDGGDHIIENNASGCSSGPEILDNCLFSIAESSLANDIIMTPNPVSDKLQIRLGEGIVLESTTIYSIVGEELFFTSEEAVDCSQLSSGIYFVKVTTDRGSVTKKIVKE